MEGDADCEEMLNDSIIRVIMAANSKVQVARPQFNAKKCIVKEKTIISKIP